MTRPGWFTVALAGAGGFFVGVILVIALGGPQAAPTKTVTSVATALTSQVGVVVKVRVPALVGLPLPDARNRLKAAGFDADVGGMGVAGIFGEVFDGDFQVVSQDPGPTIFLVRGSAVHLEVRGS